MRFSPGCQCCETELCCGCSAVPSQWTFSLSGVSGTYTCEGFAGFDDCAEFNGTYTLNYSGGASCVWGGTNGNTMSCSPTRTPTALLACTETVWFVAIRSSPDASITFYELARASWNCLDENVMTLQGTPSQCSNWPSTITITPV